MKHKKKLIVLIAILLAASAFSQLFQAYRFEKAISEAYFETAVPRGTHPELQYNVDLLMQNIQSCIGPDGALTDRSLRYVFLAAIYCEEDLVRMENYVRAYIDARGRTPFDYTRAPNGDRIYLVHTANRLYFPDLESGFLSFKERLGRMDADADPAHVRAYLEAAYQDLAALTEHLALIDCSTPENFVSTYSQFKEAVFVSGIYADFLQYPKR